MGSNRAAALAFAAAFSFLCAAADAAEAPRIPVGLDVLGHLELLPLLKEGVVCRQHSSYDRTGGNDDGFSGTWTALRKTEAGEFVIFDTEGPGCIYRLWSAMPPEGYVKLFFDGEAQPRLACNFREMFQGKVPPFAPPLTGLSSGGWYSYHPLPFAKRCTIVAEKQTGFLAIAWHKLPQGTTVETFSPTLSPAQRAAYDAIQAYYADPAKREGEAPAEPIEWAKIPAKDGEFALATLRGPATLLGLRMKINAPPQEKWEQDHALRRTVLRIYWDRDPKPAVECPLGEFFGTGFGDTLPGRDRKPVPVKYAAVPFGMTDGFYYFRLPMPFRKAARLTIENGAGRELEVGWAADVRKGRVPQDAAYLHVQWRNHMTKAGEYVPILETAGRGHYVGTVLSMQSPHWLTYLEGDEEFYVDGEEHPSIHGTGTEDYFNCGWYFKDGPVARPFHGLTAMPDWQSRVSAYRMHVPDCVPFTKSLKVQIEHGEANDRPYTNYAIVAYWYQDSTSHEVRWKLPPAKELRFPGMLANNPGMGTFRAEEKWTAFVDLVPSMDVEAGMHVGGKAEVVPISRLGPDWDGPRRLLVTSDKPGAFVNWQVVAELADLYLLDLVIPRGRQFGIAELFVDGEPSGNKLDLYSDRFREELVPCDKPFFLKAGPRRLELRVTGRNDKGAGFSLAPGAYYVKRGDPWPKEWNIVGPFPGGDDFGYSTAYPPEKGVDIAAKYPGMGGKEIAWTKLATKEFLWLHPKLTPNAQCVAYVHTYVKSPNDRKVTAFLGLDDAGKLFVNGELVWAVPGVHHLKVDENAVPIRLKAGWNEVLIKVGQGEGHWGVAFRLQDPKLELTYSTNRGAADERR